MSDNFIFPDTPGGLPPRDPAADPAPAEPLADGFDAFGSESLGAESLGAEDFSMGFDTGGFGAEGFGDEAYGAEAFGSEPLGDGPYGAGPFGPEAVGSEDAALIPMGAAPMGDGDEGLYGLSFSESAGADPSGDGAVAEVAVEAPARREAKARRPRGKEPLVLGVHVTPKRVYGVLVRPSGETYEPLRQFVRNRAENPLGGMPGGAALSPDEVGVESDVPFEMAEGGDVQVQFGGVGEIDFSAEFAGLGVATDAAFDATSTVGELDVQAQPIVFELKDILDECEQAGFGRPALAFAIDSPDVEYVEVTVPPEKKAAKKKGKAAAGPASEMGPVKRDRLVSLLPEIGTPYDTARAAFVPMAQRDGLRRYLAVLPTASEPVSESLEMLREQGAYRKTVFRTLEAEVPLLVGLVRHTLAPDVGENTAVVRVGAEDTIVLLLSGGDIHHYEKMQSVTAFDGPDTICSRVLLQQDVQGIGEVHNVVVVAEEREKELVQGFAAFYPEARVETLREGLASLGLVGPYGPLAPSLVEAAGAALAGHLVKQKGSPFDDANLLAPSLRKRKRTLDLVFSWHTLVVAVMLFLSVLFFSYLFVSQKGDIAAAEQRLAEYPPEAQMSVPQLQARIDSLRLRQAELGAALGALDSLLVDTDRWTQTVLRTTRAASATGGVWIEEWNPSGTDVGLQGFATSRGNVVGLAQRLDATIEEVTFQALREYPVYQYRMRFTQPPELPQITRVMREQAGEAVAGPPASALDAPSPVPSAQ